MERKIYYHDTDAGGVVYYGNYLKYMEEARTEFLENKGVKIGDILYAVSKCNLTYKSPARYGDTITCDATLIKTSAVKMLFEQKIIEKGTNRLLVEAEVTLVSLNKDFKPTPIPEDVKTRIA